MWKIRNRIEELQHRESIPKYQKVKEKNKDSNIVRTERKKLYEYYKCDYCGDEIRLDKEASKRSGGVIYFPHTLTKNGRLTLVLCNKCVNPTIKEFMEKSEGKIC